MGTDDQRRVIDAVACRSSSTLVCAIDAWKVWRAGAQSMDQIVTSAVTKQYPPEKCPLVNIHSLGEEKWTHPLMIVNVIMIHERCDMTSLITIPVRHKPKAGSSFAKHRLQIACNDIWPFPRCKVPSYIVITFMYDRTCICCQKRSAKQSGNEMRANVPNVLTQILGTTVNSLGKCATPSFTLSTHSLARSRFGTFSVERCPVS